MSLEPVGSPSTTARSPMGLNDPAQGASAGVSAGRPFKKFVVLATPRSGSSHLVDLLDSHPQLSCLGELFNPHGAALRKLGLRNKNDMRQAGEKPLEFLQRVMKQQQESEPYKPYFGFKLMLHHDPRLIDHVLEDSSWEIIVLERQNLLAQWTSAGLAKKTGRWGPGKKAGEGKKGDDKAEAEDEEDDLDDLDEDKAPEMPRRRRSSSMPRSTSSTASACTRATPRSTTGSASARTSSCTPKTSTRAIRSCSSSCMSIRGPWNRPARGRTRPRCVTASRTTSPMSATRGRTRCR